ncbi:outer envelope membrane protein 7 [Argentina anserina]|uniref:outer envelope membrane protein 7 n=1 Tax=Argentina anserina TaxID=57926 RepID=UPI0021765929|nr:outer envelope membrane protein 7 [Potentilla anserina]
MGAITSAAIAIVGVVLGWITIEIACKPCLDQGRQAIDRNLNPDYDPDDIRAPLNTVTNVEVHGEDDDDDNPKAAVSSVTK